MADSLGRTGGRDERRKGTVRGMTGTLVLLWASGGVLGRAGLGRRKPAASVNGEVITWPSWRRAQARWADARGAAGIRAQTTTTGGAVRAHR